MCLYFFVSLVKKEKEGLLLLGRLGRQPRNLLQTFLLLNENGLILVGA